MPRPRIPDPVLLVIAAFSRHDAALAWSRERLQNLQGPIGLTSPDYAFTQTTYYAPTMGTGLIKRFYAFRDLVPADCLPDVKNQTIALETELAASGAYPEPRPLNLDPGILSLGKFQLATTKDQAHRIYLHDGIFAEVTLRYQAGAFHPWEWTYADYRQPCVLDFMQQARDYYREQLRQLHKGEAKSPGTAVPGLG